MWIGLLVKRDTLPDLDVDSDSYALDKSPNLPNYGIALLQLTSARCIMYANRHVRSTNTQ